MNILYNIIYYYMRASNRRVDAQREREEDLHPHSYRMISFVVIPNNFI